MGDDSLKGILSNFATPLIDDYNSHLMLIVIVDKGSGYKALQFGVAQTQLMLKLQALLDTAITQQKNGQIKQVYVKNTEVSGLHGLKMLVDKKIISRLR